MKHLKRLRHLKRPKIDKKIHPFFAWPLVIIFSVAVFSAMLVQNKISSLAEKQIVEHITEFPVWREVTAEINYGNGNIRKFKGPVSENTKALDLLQEAAALGAIDFELIDHFAVKRINGLENGDGEKQWNIYVNGKKRELSPFEINVNPGDEIVFKFE